MPPRQPEPDRDGFTPGSATVEPFDIASVKKMRGSGWEGDLAELRAARVGPVGDVGDPAG